MKYIIEQAQVDTIRATLLAAALNIEDMRVINNVLTAKEILTELPEYENVCTNTIDIDQL